MKEPLRSKVYNQLLEMIVNCEFEPNSFITEDQLIEIAGTSRTPVREAVQKLEEDHLVRIFPKRGIYVCELTPRNLREIFEIRKLLEPFIIRKYGYRVSREGAQRSIESTKRALESGDYLTDPSDEGVHQLVVNASSNEHLVDLIRVTYIHSRRLRVGAKILDAESHIRSYTEHIEILQNIIDGDYERAATLMEQHLDWVEKFIYDSMVRKDYPEKT